MNLDRALDECKKNVYVVRAKTTAASYTNALRLFRDYLFMHRITGASDITQLTMEHFISYPAHLAEQNYSKQTIGVYMAAAKFFMDWLIIGNHIQPGYAETLRYKMAVEQVKKKREVRLPKTPKEGDDERMVAAVKTLNDETPRKERDIALILFLYSSGCRNAEVAQLTVNDIDLGDKSAIVIGKGNKQRIVFFNDETASALRAYWVARGSSDRSTPAFARHDRGAGKKKLKRLTTVSVRNIVDQVATLAGIEKGKFTPHHFRHAFGIRVLRKTRDLAATQDLMGHATPASTRIYAKIRPDELQEAHREVFEE